mmetsp:Transcript_43596/g.68155  ORF Transcript_43596/g.68155 Transcript_43596/m.68155 type:complete len:295 (-) Transcript_43596:930-1814(-)
MELPVIVDGSAVECVGAVVLLSHQGVSPAVVGQNGPVAEDGRHCVLPDKGVQVHHIDAGHIHPEKLGALLPQERSDLRFLRAAQALPAEPRAQHDVLVRGRGAVGAPRVGQVHVPVHAHRHHGEHEAGHRAAVALVHEVAHLLAHHAQGVVLRHELRDAVLVGSLNNLTEGFFGVFQNANDTDHCSSNSPIRFVNVLHPHLLHGLINFTLLCPGKVAIQAFNRSKLEPLPALLFQFIVFEGQVRIQLHKLCQLHVWGIQREGNIVCGPSHQGAYCFIATPASSKIILDVSERCI